MTIDQAIAMCDALRPNRYPRALKIGWLGKLDGRLFRELLMTHADCPADSFEGYDASTDGTTELLVPDPYAQDIYNYFLQAQIDKENGETTRYNQSITMYNSSFRAFANDYHRTHLPLSVGSRFVF
ncbi:MAG: hypothetical protein IJD81_09140 [Oscillospiraceae bacterium]|nr:hypothetical protein [Oscillospiraceae bacterium]